MPAGNCGLGLSADEVALMSQLGIAEARIREILAAEASSPHPSGLSATERDILSSAGARGLYAAFNILTGKVIGRITQRHRAKEFLDFLRQIDRKTPKELDLHLILDNSSTHKTADVKAWLAKHPRFKLHFTPTSASWLNAVEGWFGQLERRALYRGIFTSVGELKSAIKKYIKVHNDKLAKPFRWHKSAESIMTSVARAKLSLIDNKSAN